MGSLLFSLSALLLVGCKEETAPAPKAVVPPIASMVIPVCVNGECAVLDQNGALLVQAENDYDMLVSAPLNNTFIFAKDGLWNLANADGKQVLKANFTDDLRLLTPGYFGFGRDGKLGVMDEHGKEIQPAQYDDLYVGGDNDFIVYEVNGKRGILSASGQLITEPLFDSSVVRSNFAKSGWWMTAERDGELWAVNIKTHEQKKVGFASIDSFANEHLVVSSSEQLKGLADAKANLVSELKYFWLGTPGDGLVAFKEKYDSPCGYMDFQGKTVIPATFSACEAFGQKGALAKKKGADNEEPKAGLIGRNGESLEQLAYDSIEGVGATAMGLFGNVPGYTHTGVLHNMFSASFGIYDVNKGVELFKPTYLQIGALNADLFIFSKADSPTRPVTLYGESTRLPTVGVMDASGKVLIEPSEYVDIRLDASGHYLRAKQDSAIALYDLSGKRLIAAKWQELVIDEARGAIFGYELEGSGDDQTRSLRALYHLDGTPSFQTSQIDCGAQQVRDGSGQVLWPANPEAHCPEPVAETVGDDTQDEETEQE